MDKEFRPHQVVYLKTVSVEALIDDSDGGELIKLSTDGGQTWSLVNKKNIITAIPLK